MEVADTSLCAELLLKSASARSEGASAQGVTRSARDLLVAFHTEGGPGYFMIFIFISLYLTYGFTLDPGESI